MNERTALEIASRLEALIPIAGGLAVEALRRQHAEIERLKTVPMKYRRMAFNAQLQEENAQLSEKIDSLTKERDAAIAAAVAAERDACAAVCENGNFLHDAAPTAIFGKECARAIRARSAS
jgi:hypothetical protein